MIFSYTHYKVNDPELLRKWTTRLKLGSGLSPDIMMVARCSICGQDYGICNHVPGQKYDDSTAVIIIEDFEIPAISLVNSPRQRGCEMQSICIPIEWCNPMSETAIKSIPICDNEHTGHVTFEGYVSHELGLREALDKMFGPGCWHCPESLISQTTVNEKLLKYINWNQ